ncbi:MULTISPECIES: IclR family transcriptional regulator domain-containing protein [Halomonadaceae]|jgi:IclR family pca regulon transcriptional regulator|uniref:Beta-ketoadipate transcriptional regulator, PcaR/PcaU/PobR n=1 Tax=Vreelandella titanicae BH1 TaxID=1204738 RepID=L9UF45_9GAMM|nr:MULTISPECIES: IclR family transcriptional regulator C-terminal domain-containing protein [Halomonas]UEQ04176.1 helix-turn-helix domain-containing protein [Halomonas profundus]ELY22838.1 Beta-ketoadipate transcriptional regulator, PcaR/PcaU/PobR [Halomonas titanicae BH1]KIN17020.1 IclR family transcriptional regulator [Halomonas sp. KHS3]MCE7517842.1 helix-turn-helix domain-containing protein [Halomonas titanicae]NVE89187.1 helix-turn-helix domain-containing protein [Halomonas titanicae]|tara:strand:- start:210 stop:989 length:780 start_codon:yes stop_codon:yes gene_type:complete
MQEEMLSEDNRDFVTALASGLEVIQAFDHEHPRMTLSEVAARTGMNRAKARRFLLTLHALGYVRKQQRYFELAPRVLQLGYAFLSANNYRDVIQQHLEDITAETGESSSLGVLDGNDVIYVARSAAKHRLMAITLSVGTRLPAAHTSMGRMLLAQLSDTDLDHFLSSVALESYTDKTVTDVSELRNQIIKARQQGYAISDQELDSGLRSIAVPVYDAKQHLMGAINISTNAARVDLDTLINVYLPVLQNKVAQVRAHIN